MKLENILKENYEDIEGKIVETLNNKTDEIGTILLKQYEEWLDDLTRQECKMSRDCDLALSKLCFYEGEYSAEDITNFAIKLHLFEERQKFSLSGIFLSTLINVHYKYTETKEPYKLILTHIDTRFTKIGMQNEGAEILVIGNVGSALGYEMKKGNITINGDCDECAGYFMEGGILTVQNAGPFFADELSGGIIKARTVDSLSPNILKGEIHVAEGELRIPKLFNASRDWLTIYHRDEKIFP